MAIDGEGWQPLLGMGSQHSGQVDGAGALGAVEAPYRLDGAGVHVEGLAAVAPAAGNGQRSHHIFGLELVGTGCGFGAAADGGIGNDTLHRGAVRVTQVFFDQGLGITGHGHGLVLQTFTNAAPAAVDGGTDTDFGIKHLALPPFSSEWFYRFRRRGSTAPSVQVHTAAPARCGR